MKLKGDTSDLCWECTGSGLMIGNYPCKVCNGTGKLTPEQVAQFNEGVSEADQKAVNEVLDSNRRLRDMNHFSGYLDGIAAAHDLVPEHMLDLRIRILQLGQTKK